MRDVYKRQDPYMAVGIALSSDVLASAVSAYTYHKNKNLDIKNGPVSYTHLDVYKRQGNILPVAGTPMDFRAGKPIGRDIDTGFSQTTMVGGGYDLSLIHI